MREFPQFKVRLKNFANAMAPCIYDPVTDKLCPIFRIGQIIETIEKDEKEREWMLKYGSVIKIQVDWNCNLDMNIEKCKPSYSFRKLSTNYHADKFSNGFNFRFVSHWKDEQGHRCRTLTKAFGLRFLITIGGESGKFDLLTLTMNIGSIFAIFGVAAIVCNIFSLYLCPEAKAFRQHIYERVDDRTFYTRRQGIDYGRNSSIHS
ncbi:unnamed protein product [Didymodactylos carnosus]|uniref:ATP receptor n=1 Tax=Didymodactylos carnosus TaxID=1234261 RepID=A0A814GCH6_9BILA|nr:unnamed protein product [Didymodactylos carnosus]CAF1259496.1 unnamed protein product [Didymodactylos carnosus]CAF3766652.1 unnamed protein product [Didymodactylos carnosus]CAF4066223.1 unnamed protein product [Didymodactylos carnosus]